MMIRRQMDIFRLVILLLILVLCTPITSGYTTTASTSSRHPITKNNAASPGAAAPTVRNPHSKRKIQVGGPTYRGFLQEGRWVQHDGTFLPLDLVALRDHQDGRDFTKTTTSSSSSLKEKNKATTNIKVDEKETLTSSQNDWHCILPSAVVGSPNDGTQHRRPLTPEEATMLGQELLFVYKPSGLNCVPSRNESDGSLSSEVAAAFGPGAKPCHRLDRDTSGIVVFGLTAEAHRNISKQFEARTTTKTYLALIAGHPRATGDDTGIIDLPIGKQKTAEGYNRWAIGGEKQREAVTEWQVNKRYTTVEGATFSRMALFPKTGRGHQLRLHMLSMGCPILGDTLHATDTGVAACAPRLCLHAWKLQVDWKGLRLEAVSVARF
jgi:tRNA pseudouridine32 synthase/23S rRNA pseudouridine746 synthase